MRTCREAWYDCKGYVRSLEIHEKINPEEEQVWPWPIWQGVVPISAIIILSCLCLVVPEWIPVIKHYLVFFATFLSVYIITGIIIIPNMREDIENLPVEEPAANKTIEELICLAKNIIDELTKKRLEETPILTCLYGIWLIGLMIWWMSPFCTGEGLGFKIIFSIGSIFTWAMCIGIWQTQRKIDKIYRGECEEEVHQRVYGRPRPLPSVFRIMES